MPTQANLIKLTLLIYICFHIQAVPFFQREASINEDDRSTENVRQQSNLSLCVSDGDCRMNSWCDENKCQCVKGWLTWHHSSKCSYKQLSKFVGFTVSFIFGSIGVDWFVLSRKNSLYVLTGVLKFLITFASLIWSRLAVMNKNEVSMSLAGRFGAFLSIISIIWWCVDWFRILFGRFPDGNGAPLI